MKPTKPFHHHAATDRTRPVTATRQNRPTAVRVAVLLMAALVSVPLLTPVMTVATMPTQTPADITAEAIPTEPTTSAEPTTVAEATTPAEALYEPSEATSSPATNGTLPTPETMAAALMETLSERIEAAEPAPSDGDAASTADADTPLTQEAIARRVESQMNQQARGGSRIYYPYPSGAMAVDLYKDGRQVLKGQVADIGGTVYVPVQRFADLFGSFQTTYTEATEQVVITGTNLSITVKVGDPYITVNERIFYTGQSVISLGGWIFVPLTAMCRAVNATVTIRPGYFDAFITSGDPTAVAWASDYYDETDLYWLSRIISAEARGEPFAGQIAVGNVVLNRVRSSQFPNTVKDVIFDTKYGTQFSPVASGTIYQTPTAAAVRAAKICLEGYSLSNTILYFYNPAIATSTWIGRTRPYVMTIGNHKFYA